MTGHIAIIGNSMLNIGAVMAADLTLGGEEVRLFLWPDQTDLARAAEAAGGLTLREPADQTKSGRTGRAASRIVTDSPAEAVAGAALVVLDVTGDEVEKRFRELLPHLENGQVVHVNTHGYWPSLRVAGLLRASDKAGVIMTEGVTPSIAAGRDGAEITPHTLRRNVLAAAFPASRTEAARAQLSRIFHSFEMARDVLHSNLSGMNFLIHPGIALVNIGYFDRAAARGERISFYGTGNTENAMRMTEALDAERPAVAAQLDVPCPSVSEQVARIYGLSRKPLGELVAEVPFYRDLPPLPAEVWKAWMLWDIPHAHVPFVLLAEALGQPAPLHRGLVEIMDALVGMSSWRDGVTLERLGLEGMSAAEMTRFVRQGSH